MAVEEIHLPPRTSNIDPKAASSKVEPSYWETQAKAARAQREYLEERELAKRITHPEPTSEPPFQVKGGINLGTIDVQENMRRAEERADLERKEAQRLVAEERTRREAAEDRAKQLEIASVREQLAQGMAALERQIQQGNRQPRSFLEQLEEMQALSAKLGYLVPGSMTSSGESPALKLEMLRLNAQMAREEREFKQQIRNDDKKWQMELARLEIDKKDRIERLNNEKTRNEMFANAFQTIGQSIAEGLKATSRDMDMENPVPDSAPVARQRQEIQIQAEVGRAGEITCPQCQTPIGVGPNSVKAACAQCGLICAIERVPATPAPSQTTPSRQYPSQNRPPVDESGDPIEHFPGDEEEEELGED